MRRLALVLFALGGCGCSAPPGVLCARPETAEPIEYRGGEIVDGVYWSTQPDGELLHYPAGAYYKIFHNLGTLPRDWDFELSFNRFGPPDGSLAEAAGNQAEVKAFDEESITVLNGTCSDYWLLAIVSPGTTP